MEKCGSVKQRAVGRADEGDRGQIGDGNKKNKYKLERLGHMGTNAGGAGKTITSIGLVAEVANPGRNEGCQG